MKKQKPPKPNFSHLLSCETLRRPNDNFEYLWGKKGQKILPKSTPQPPKADEEFTVLEPFEEGKCWQPSLFHSHRACVCWADLCHPSCMDPIDQIQLKSGPGVDTDLWLRSAFLWWPWFRSKKKKISLSPLEEKLLNFYWIIFTGQMT